MDDQVYVYENSIVTRGLTASGFVWAFTAFAAGNWHPLTFLSHMLDCQLFGVNAGAHHLVNLALHLASSILLFLAVARMTKQPWRSAVVAAVFALHPLHVESVAWVAERKDVLSGFFGILTILLYVRYTETRTTGRYFLMAVAFALGLMAKPMLVTLPFVLLLLDLWPMRRMKWPPAWPVFKGLLWEKAPLLIMIVASSVVTFFAQRSFGFVVSIVRIPLADRFGNVAFSYVRYIGKAFWPTNLAVFYPSAAPPAVAVVGSLVVLSVITFTCLWLARRAPYLFVGWFWFLGMLVPVIGIVQVGDQSIADRYMYLPLIGLSLAAVWGAAELCDSRRPLRNAAAVLTGIVLLLFAAMTYRQTGFWKDSRTLFEHSLAVTPGNAFMHYSLGLALSDQGEHNESLAHFRKALAFSPDFPEGQEALGREFAKSGNFDESFSHLSEAVRLKPNLASARMNLGVLLAARGNFEEAKLQLEESLRLASGNPEGHNNLCYVLQRLGRLEEAILQCTEALQIKPEFADARFNLGTGLAALGKNSEAMTELNRVLQVNPNHAGAIAALQRLQSH